MSYDYVAIAEVPQAAKPLFQHMLDTYASETSKTVSVWRCFTPEELSFRPHPRARTVLEIMQHQLLSERRFFGEFMGLPEPPGSQVLPTDQIPEAYAARICELAQPRLDFLSGQAEAWWLEPVTFFDVERSRIWVFWRRLLHTCHHRTQLTVYLRMLNKRVPSTYGPTADVTWEGADPTQTVAAAERR